MKLQFTISQGVLLAHRVKKLFQCTKESNSNPPSPHSHEDLIRSHRIGIQPTLRGGFESGLKNMQLTGSELKSLCEQGVCLLVLHSRSKLQCVEVY